MITAGMHDRIATKSTIGCSVALMLAVTLLTAARVGAETPIPQLSLWEANMRTYGQLACDYLGRPHTFDEYLSEVYYDAHRVFQQVAEYTGDAAWLTCAQRAATIYRDQYVMTATCWDGGVGCVPGYWNFTHGLTLDYLRTGNAASKDAVMALAEHAAYAADTTPLEETVSPWLSREVAYAIMSYINAEKIGASPRARLRHLVDQALGHLDQWFVSRSFRCPSMCDPAEAAGQYYIQPFMVGLTAQALIMYADATGDGRVLPAIKNALDWLWANAWIAADQSFWYENWVPDPSIPFPAQPGAPDLDLLIAPAFAWVYRQTGDVTYRDRGDAVFAGGVLNAYLGGGKQFDQNYSWSFDYVKWRGTPTVSPPPPPASVGTLAVAMTQPKTHEMVGGTAWAVVWITGAAGAANAVTLTLGNRTVASTTSTSMGPIALPYDSTLVTNGPQTLTASVRDERGKTGTRSVSVNVRNATSPSPAPLTADFTAPGAGASVAGTATVAMSAAGGTTPYTYTLDLDGVALVSSDAASYAWNTKTVSDASHTLTVTVRDAAGASATARRTVTVANTAPASRSGLKAYVTQPRGGSTVSRIVWIVIWLEGAQGGANAYTIRVNGQSVAMHTTTSTGPVSLRWDTTNTPNGPQTVSIEARDAAGNFGTTSVAVTVAN